MKNNRKITKAIIAAAGYGTRFLPATKNQPKEMLPIIDKPIIHYLVEEAVNSGITDIVLVTRAGNHIMEDYFDNQSELETALKAAGKEEQLATIRNIPLMANFIYVRQKKHLPYGNGSPLLAAKSVIDDDEAVVYMFGDDLTLSEVPVVKQLIDVYEKYQPAAVAAAQEVPWEEVVRYGVFEYKDKSDVPYEMQSIVEKPNKDEAPSNKAQDGRFILSYEVIKELENTPKGKGNELWLTDAFARLAEKGHTIIAQPINGEWLTTGDPLRYLQATIKFALDREDINGDFLEFLKKVIK
jgi:UTP--glucose-1-phosphate uridylyltransferase